MWTASACYVYNSCSTELLLIITCQVTWMDLIQHTDMLHVVHVQVHGDAAANCGSAAAGQRGLRVQHARLHGALPQKHSGSWTGGGCWARLLPQGVRWQGRDELAVIHRARHLPRCTAEEAGVTEPPRHHQGRQHCYTQLCVLATWRTQCKFPQ
jgi:hypothetical protein